MPGWEQLYYYNSSNVIALALAAGIILIGLFLAVAALIKTRQLERRYSRLVMGREGLNLEELIGHHGDLLLEEIRNRQKTECRLTVIENQLQRAVSGVGLVRYNAFKETGSDLSYSLALLDRNRDGVVLTSLFGRDESRCYGKPITKGQSSHHLSEEEGKALERARRRIDEKDKAEQA